MESHALYHPKLKPFSLTHVRSNSEWSNFGSPSIQSIMFRFVSFVALLLFLISAEALVRVPFARKSRVGPKILLAGSKDEIVVDNFQNRFVIYGTHVVES